jgi:hypothetical protein
MTMATLAAAYGGWQAVSHMTLINVRLILLKLVDVFSVEHQTASATPRCSIEIYEYPSVPRLHTAHPTSVFDHIDINLIDERENYSGEKFLSIPFDTEVRNPEHHGRIRGRIFAAVMEITDFPDSSGVGSGWP